MLDVPDVDDLMGVKERVIGDSPETRGAVGGVIPLGVGTLLDHFTERLEDAMVLRLESRVHVPRSFYFTVEFNCHQSRLMRALTGGKSASGGPFFSHSTFC